MKIQDENILDLISFQKNNKKDKLRLAQYSNIDSLSNCNQKQVFKEEQLKKNSKNDKSYFVVFKIKELIFKCYPQLILAFKKGLSLKKLMQQYRIDEIPSSFDQNSKYMIYQ